MLHILILLAVVAGCGPLPPPEQTSDRWRLPRTTVTTTAPEPFLGIAGVTSFTTSSHTHNEFGHSSGTRMSVSRAGKVVCEMPFGSSGHHENHQWDDDASVELASREPLRFVVKRNDVSRESAPDFDAHSYCTGFELPSGAACRQIFDRSCTHEVCMPRIAISPMPGSGTLKGHVMQELEPIVGATLVVGQQFALADEHGAFALETGPGTHVLEIGGAYLDVQRVNVPVGPHEDVEVTIDIRCTHVDDPDCCKF